MGWRFRKSIKILPGIRMNIGKKSVGVSIGSKYGGISYNSRTGARRRFSIPGTGISYSEKVQTAPEKIRANAKKLSSLKRTELRNAGLKKPFYKKWWFWGIIIFILLGLIFGDDNSADGETQTVIQETPATNQTEESLFSTDSTDSSESTVFESGLEVFTSSNVDTALDDDLRAWLSNNLGDDYVLSLHGSNIYYGVSNCVSIAVFPYGDDLYSSNAQAGDPEAWLAFVEQIKASSVSIAEAYGRSCFIEVASYRNHHISLIRVLDGEVVYDHVLGQ